MNKITQIAKSRTFWTLVVLFVVNGVGAIQASIPADILRVVNMVLGMLTTYFHVNPSQNYSA